MKKRDLDWEGLHSQLESQQKAGSSALVLRHIQNLPWSRMSHRWRVAFANLARRAGGPLLSLKILNHSRDSWRRLQSDSERLAYAAGLFALGNRLEAGRWLDQIHASEMKNEGLFFQALALMREWDYSQALEVFRRYQSNARPTGYRELVVRVNCVACLVALEKEPEALRQIKMLRLDLQREKAHLLLDNLEEIELQMRRSGDNRSIKSGQAFRQGTESHQLFAEKWQVLARTHSMNRRSFIRALEKLRIKAQEVGHWETVRDLDFRQVERTRDPKLFAKLFWGTPHQAFRARLNELSLPLGEGVRLGPSGGSRSAVIELDPWRQLGVGSLNERLFRALLSDLYRPLSMGEIFEKTHPEERFNPETSPSRVRRGLQRLQKWLVRQDWGVSIITRKGEFRLVFRRPVVLRVSFRSALVERLKEAFGDCWFSRQQAQTHLQMPERTARRALNQLVEQNHLEEEGANRNRRYRVRESA